MPTPVSTAKQCLTSESSQALDEAVVVAHRRGHSQTTSLHATSAFLSHSILRDACSRIQSSTYSSRLQFRALELCFGSALDRLPSQTLDAAAVVEPPISNSLMAAIKRSQANQRRHPDSFHLYQQQQQQQSSFSCVKVELQHLILSILDDPVVSKVFGEAGFRSCDVRLAILRPLPRRCPPLFLCNLPTRVGIGGDSSLGQRGFSFPFSNFPGFYGGVSDGCDENCKRIGEVLVQDKKRNPLLVGFWALDALRSFSEVVVGRKTSGVLPVEVSGLSFFDIEKEVSCGNEGLLRMKMEELDRVLMENCERVGVVVSFGDLNVFVADESNGDFVSYVVSQLTRLLEVHRGKLWLIGGTASYEMYLQFLLRFPTIEKDWDLHLLTITSLKPSMSGFQSRPHSLMESFVPFGGFFSTPSELTTPLSRTDQSMSRCHLCNEKYEQEVSVISKGGSTPSVADHYQANLPSWLQAADLSTNKDLDLDLDVIKAKDDGRIFNAKMTGLQKKWDDICRRLNHILPVFGSDIYQSVGLQRISSSNPKMLGPVASEAKNDNFVSKEKSSPSKSQASLHKELTNCIPNVHAPSSSPLSVTTDLGLGTLYTSTFKDMKKPTSEACKARLEDFSGCFPLTVDAVVPSISNPPVRSSPGSCPDLSGQYDLKDFKTLRRTLTEKVGSQCEAAIHTISQTIACCKKGNERRRGASLKRDIWLNFLGPDKAVKGRIAVALAEIIFGSKHNIISVDLSFYDGISRTIFGAQVINGNDLRFRGKTVVDYIADEIRRKPQAVVFLENIDKADVLVQNSLSQAIKTGKFADSHGRETSINNIIFVTTSRCLEKIRTLSEREDVKFYEERISRAQSWQMQILIRYAPEDSAIRLCSNVRVLFGKDVSTPAFRNKRKLIGIDESPKRAHKVSRCLDLNLPIDENEENDVDSGSSDSDCVSENSELWLEDFFLQVDETIVFKPFDFDALAEDILKDISEVFWNSFGSEGVLEIDSRAMDQILAAAWLSDKKKSTQEWVRQVLLKSFEEARQRYSIKARSILKLVTCEGVYMGEQAPGVCLPSRIILN